MKDEWLQVRGRPLPHSWVAFTVLFVICLNSNTALRAQSFTVSGIMQHSTLEGGCWYLQGNDGKHYELFGDSATLGPLLIPGAFVELSVAPMKGASICMIGEMVRVLNVESVHLQPIDLPINFMIVDGAVHRTKTGTWYLTTADGARYEFQDPPPKKKRHSGARMHGRVRILMDKKSTKEQMDGVILSDAPPPKLRMAPGKKYNPQ